MQQTTRNLSTFVRLHFKNKSIRRLFFLAIAFTVFSSVFQVMAAWQLGTVFSKDFNNIWAAALVWALFCALQYMSNAASDLTLVKTTFRISSFWRKNILRLLFLPRESFEKSMSEGDAASRATTDCDGIESEISSILERVVFLGLNITTVTLGASFISWEISLTIFLSCLPSLFIPTLFSSQVQKRFLKVAKSSSEVAQSSKDILDQWAHVRSLNAETYGSALVEKTFESNRKLGIKASFLTSGLSSVCTALAYLPFLATALVAFSSLSTISIALMIAAVKLSYDISSPLRNAANEIINIHAISGQLTRIKEAVVLSNKLDIESHLQSQMSESTSLKVKDLEIPIQNDSVKWKAFHAKAGEIIAIRGPSGSGKSTALKALTGKLQVSHGSVTLKGTKGAGVRYFSTDLPALNKDLIAGVASTLNISRPEASLKVQSLPKVTSYWGYFSSSSWANTMIQWTASLASNTQVVVFDETLTDLTDDELNNFKQLLQETNQSVIVMIATHDDRIKGTREIRVADRHLVAAKEPQLD